MEGEEEGKKEPFLAALLGNPNPESIFILAEKLGKNCVLFKEVTLPGTAVAILLAHSISIVQSDFKSSQVSKINIVSRQLLEYFLSLLSHPTVSSSYIFTILQSVTSLCTGEVSLSDGDICLLRELVKDKSETIESIIKEGTVPSQETSSSIQEGHTSSSHDTKTSEGRIEVHKLFSQMKTGGGGAGTSVRKKAGSLPAVHFERSPETSSKSILTESMAHLKELKGVQKLMECCIQLPILVELREKKRELFTACNKTEQQEKIHQLKTVVGCILLISSLTPSLVPLTSHLLTDITTLVKYCVIGSTTYLTSLYNILLQSSPKPPREVQEVVATTSDVSTDDSLAVTSSEELLKRLYCTATGVGMKSMICEMVVTTVKIVKKIESFIEESPRSKSLNVFTTMIIYELFSGLMTLLLPSTKGTELKTTIGQTKFTVPLGQLTLLGVQMTSELLFSLNEEPEQESLPRIQGAELDINGTYSEWQLVQLLLEGVSLISILLSIGHCSYRKSLALIESCSREGSQTELINKDSFATPLKPEKTEKPEQYFRRLQDALSSKITETMSKEEGSGDGSRTVSPSSSVSSSGEVRGEYVVNPEQERGGEEEEGGEGEEEEGEDEEDEESNYEEVEALMGSILLPGMFTPTTVPAPPPPPPLPPKKSKLAKMDVLTPSGPPLPPRDIKYLLKGEGGMDSKKKPLFYRNLALISLRALLQGVVQNTCGNLQSVLIRSIGPEHVSSLTWLFLNVQNTSPQSVSSIEFTSTVQELIRDLIVNRALSFEHHGPLLRDLGLVPGCWPLSMAPPTLSLLACVLVLRSEREDDPLSLNIWKGFLSTLEENAANENESEEDLPVTHLQLLLVVWHSFSDTVRRSLLVQCVNAVIRVADEKQSGSLVPPLACCRLLLVLQYMIFQFNQLVPQIFEQVESNLLSGVLLSDPDGSTPTISFPCDQEFQYQRVFTKPGVSNDVLKYKRSDSIQPMFYNVTPPDSADLKKEIDSDACKLLLTLPLRREEGGERGGVKGGYDKFHNSLITLMSVGTDYRLYCENVYSRVVAACAGHQCMDLCLHMLVSLPPSHNVLTAIVEGTGLSCKTDPGSCLLILVLLFSVKLRMKQIDTDDIVDTLTESGYSSDSSEELIARIMSVVDSTDHFISLTSNVLNDLCSLEHGQSLPLVSITATNLLICLLLRTLQESIGSEEEEEEESGEEEEEEGEGEGEGEGESKEEKAKETKKDSQVDKEQLKASFYKSHSQTLIPILLKVTRALVNSAHRNICLDLFNPDQNIAEEMIEVIDKILNLSSCKLILSKNKPLFISHIPVPMSERLKTWNSISVLDKSQLHNLCYNISEGMNVMDEIFSTLHCSLLSSCGTNTFSPNKLLKTTLLMSTELLLSLFNLQPESSSAQYCSEVVPLATDVLLEFAGEGVSVGGVWNDGPLKEIAKLFNAKEFSVKCTRYKVVQCFQLVQCPQLSGHTFQGALLEDIFILINQLLDSSVDWPILNDLYTNEPSTNIIDLIMLCSLSSMCTSSLTEGLKLLVKILEQSDKTTHDHLTVLCGQIATLALVPADKLEVWLRRVVLGCVNDSCSDAVAHTNSLNRFITLLVKDDCLVPTHLCHSLLTSLLSIGTDLLTSLNNFEIKQYFIFKDYFDSCVLLASKQPNKGHYELVRCTSEWLPMCSKLMSANGNDWKQNHEVLVPMSTIMGYLSRLYSAVQLVTNRSLCDERRSLAGEDDYTILIDEEDDDSSNIEMDDEQQASDEEGLNEKLCTFTETKRDFRNQHWYHCHTCKLTDGTGCCSVCVKVCHKGHDVTYSKLGSFFCDCGAKEDGSCKALVKRKSQEEVGGAISPSLGEGSTSTGRQKRRKKKSKLRSKKSDKKTSDDTKSSTSSSSSDRNRSSFPSPLTLSLSKQIETYKELLLEHFSTSGIPQCCLDVLQISLPQVLTSANKLALGSSSVVENALNELHTCDKKVEYVDNIMSSSVSCQESAVDNMKLSLTGDQGQLVKQLLNNGGVRVIRRCALASMITPKHQHLVISQDKGKVTFFQLASLLKQADNGRKKLSISRISTLMAPFPVISLCANPCNGEVLAICGVKDCQVVTINSSGSASSRISLHPSVDAASGYIVKCLWLPGSETELAIITDTFVKIYDLSIDTLSPMYYFIICSDKIRDACFVVTEETKCVLVMTSTGQLFCQPMIPECSASEGPVYFTVDFTPLHANIQESEGRVCEGGASVYYSQSLQMLFFSYKNGRSFMGTLDGTLNKTDLVVEIPLKNNTITNDNKTTILPLLDWQEVRQHPGLISAVTGNTCNPVLMMVKPNSLLIHEIKPVSVKSKIQGTSLVVQQSSNDTSVPPRTAMIMISEDGSLRVQLTTNSDTVLHWMSKQYRPATPLAYLTQFSKKCIKIKKRTTPPKIPVDFFENCTRMQNNDVEFGGSDILHVYNKEQVRNRFNVGGLYIANTKPAGFTIEVTNLQPDTTVMVGARVLLGCRSLEKTPSFIEVYGRKQSVTFPGGIARWFDVPLTREESLQSDKQFQLIFGPSMDPSCVNIVDCVRVYTKTKDEFGWPERPLTPGLALSSGGVVFGEEEGGDKEVVQLSETKRLGAVDRLVCDAFSVLGNHYLSSSSLVGVADVVKQATPLLTLSTPSQLQYHTRFLVSCIVTGTPSYTVCKDHLQLSLVKDSLFNNDTISYQPELYQHLLLILLVICRSRPSHLSLVSAQLADTLRECLNNKETESEVKSGDGCGLWVELVDKLNEMFWMLYKRKPTNINTAPVCNTGLVAIELTVSVLMEIMYTVSLQFPELLTTCIPHWIQLLTANDTQISSSCVKVLTKLLKPHPPLKVTEEKGEEVREGTREPSEGLEQEPVTDHTPTPAVAEQPDNAPPPALQAMLADPQAAMEQLMANPNLLGMMPDEEAMMNLAIAISLHEEGNEGGAAQVMQNALQNLVVPERSMSPILVHHPIAGEGENGANQPLVSAAVVQEEEEEEEEEEVNDVLEPAMIIDSLNSSYEDLIEEGVVHHLPHPPILGGQLGQSSNVGVVGGGAETRKDKEGQDVSSEFDNHNDSSGEEDNEDSSFLDVYEQFDDKVVNESSVERVGGETTPSGSDIKDDKSLQQEVLTPEHQLRLKLLVALSEHLPQVEKVGGTRAIPFMQVIVFLCGYLEGGRRDKETYNILLNALLKQLEQSREDPSIIMGRSYRSEVLLLILRFLNIIMSRKRIRTEKSEHGSSAVRLWYCTAETLLSWNCLNYCLTILKELLKDKTNFQNNESSSSSLDLLKTHSQSTHMDMSPFFQQQYVKYHSSDIFETFTVLLADIVLALPCQLKKFSEKTAPSSSLESPSSVEFNEEWMETLCEYFMATSNSSSSNKKQIRKVLIYVCGSKDNYRLIRDKYALRSYMNKINDICTGARFDVNDPTATLIHLSYDTLLKLIEQLRLCDEVARTRTSNWQSFCIERKETLPTLFTVSLSIDEGLSLTLLQLIFSALSGTHPAEKKDEQQQKSSKDKNKKKDFKTTQKLSSLSSSSSGNLEYSQTLCQLITETITDINFERFINRYLLQTNQSTLRWQTHSLIHTLYKHSPPTQQVHLVQLLWKLWPEIPKYGHKASQFVDLLGYCSISTKEVLQKENMCERLVQQAVSLLRRQNVLVAAHPNCHVYSQLVSLVDFDGHYLESEPCLVCNDPEVSLSVMKLFSIKSDVRYSANTIFIKLNGSYTFTQIMLRISEIRRSKMMRTINLYYSNRTIQNVIELKNNRSLWLKACSCTLQPSQTDLKFEFPLPIVARNVIIEFSDFYENTQVGSEMLQCPRCNASVPAYPGVCAACGENAHQCQKCRTINYDERDPFLCISCGFSKYARFETQVEGRSCSAVDPIENEDDRKKTLLSINQLLEKADTVYKQLVDQRNELDRLLVTLASGATIVSLSSSGSSSESGVNKAIQAAAQMYCNYCKTAYNDLSKIIQSVLASRRELVAYDLKKLQSTKSSPEPATPLSPITEDASLAAPLSATPISEGNCFGCASSTLEHCITVLKALAFKPETRKLMRKSLIEELMEFNLRTGSAGLQKDVQGLLCQLTRDDLESTRHLNEFITQRVLQNIKPQRTSPNLASTVQAEIRLLTASVAMEDSCWEERLRAVMLLFRKSRSHTSPVVMAAVTMPCLNILRSMVSSCTAAMKETQASQAGRIHTRVKDWLRGDANSSFDAWKKETQVEASREMQLSRKYFQIWLDKLIKAKVNVSLPSLGILKQSTWLRSMLFNRSSASARKSTYNLLLSLCKGEQRQRQILDLLSSFLDEVGSAGEASEDFLSLFRHLISEKDGLWKIYLARKGVLFQIGTLIEKEINYLRQLEESTLSSDLSQGFALQMLTTLLKSFLKEDVIKQQYKGQLVGLVLNGYLSLKRLVIQRTKLVDQSQKTLLELLEALTSGTEEEKQELMAVCIEILSNYPMSDLVTPIFVFEQLCNIIHPEEEDVGEFHLQLDKDPQQEEFLQGRMQGNPYSSRDPGVGPLMRDVKNKICTDCELVALLEDDTGMELLVCNKIISLDLPVKEVYKKIWCAQPNHTERMKVVYRMRGLLGDATEDMVESLDNGKGEDVNEEEVYKMATVLGEANRLDAILLRLSQARHFLRSHGLIHAGLKLLSYCVKVKTNRQYLIQPHLHTLKILLGILNMALQHEQLESSGLGATVAQQVLSVTEPILQEASSQQRVVVRSISEEVLVSEPSEGEDSTLQTLLRHVESPFVQSNLGVREGLMHIIPFLTFGDPRNMKILLHHFTPYLDFDRFDTEESPEHSLYLDCFSAIATGIGTDASGQKLKELLIEMKLTASVVDYIRNKTPPKGNGRFDSKEWTDFLANPSLPYVLKILTGLLQHHVNTQLVVSDAILELHLLEQVSSTVHHIGTLAEKLLEALRENTDCDKKIQEVRKATRAEKKKRAMEMRAKELGALGFQVNEKGQMVAETPTAFKEMESEVVEETGLRCCICLEGYRNQPQKILGVYTYTRKVTLDEFENKPRKTVGYATVSHFNVVHYECHSSAIKLARSRDEWESATLQNANTKCNGLLPIWGPKVSDSAFASGLANHNSYLQACTGLYDPSFRSYSHDLRLLLLRFANETSFSAESGGGGPQSNLHLIPYFIHVALYVLDTTRVYQREEKNLSNALIAPRDKWVPMAYEVEGPLHTAVLSLFIYSLAQWEEHRLTFLRQLIVLAHARKTSSSPIKCLPAGSELLAYGDYKPVLIFYAMIDAIHRLLKKTISVSGAELPQAVLEYIRNNDKAISDDCDKVLSKYQEELLPAESFEEFCDIMGLLTVIDNPAVFMKELIASVTNTSSV